MINYAQKTNEGETPRTPAEQDEHIAVARDRAQLFERLETGAAVALEKRSLRFHDRELVIRRIEHASTEGERALGCVGQAAGFQERRGGIDTDAQRSVRGETLLESESEGRHCRLYECAGQSTE